ncbi:MAG: diphthamide biosynthesis enzyme Dph2 [Sulfolobales archaeon]
MNTEDNYPPYDFEIERLVNYIKERNYKKILIQIPDGLKIYVPYIYNELKRRLRDYVEIVFSGDSAWGSCMLIDHEAEKGDYDLLVHIGHIEYPYYKSSFNTLYIPAYSLLDVDQRTIERVIEILRSYNAKRIGIFSTIQHERLLPKIRNELSKYFDIISSGKGSVVMGCEYSAPYSVIHRVDAFVIVSGGVFHGLGLGLYEITKPVIKIDPYEGKAIDLTQEIHRIRRIRYYKIMQALNARHWILIDGVRGQRREWYRKYLEKLIRDKEGEYITYISENITRELLLNIDTEWVDAYVVLACPRIPIDDLSDFHKPVLTPAEARMALTGKIDKYSFPW